MYNCNGEYLCYDMYHFYIVLYIIFLFLYICFGYSNYYCYCFYCLLNSGSFDSDELVLKWGLLRCTQDTVPHHSAAAVYSGNHSAAAVGHEADPGVAFVVQMMWD